MMLFKFREYMEQERFLISASLLRIVLGFLILYNYLMHYAQRYFLWSNDGINIYSEAFKHRYLSLYNLTDSNLYFDIVYHLGILIALIYLVGYKGRIFGILNYIFFYSLYIRTMYISDGGDNLLNLCLLFLVFSDNTRFFSIDAFNKKRARGDNPLSFMHRLKTIVHNFAVMFCVVQLCIVYFFSGAYQLMGELWQNGTAIYYISQVNEFSRPILRRMVHDYLWVSIIFSYLSIFVKLTFPFSIMNKKIKPFIVGFMVFFHAGIGIGMGLLTFSLTMIVMELLVFTDKEFRTAVSKMAAAYRKCTTVLPRFCISLGERYLASQRILVFYDGWCPMCRGVVSRIAAMDYFRLITCVSFRDDAVITEYSLVPEEVQLRMHSTKITSMKMKQGIHSVFQICCRLLPLWPFVPLIHLFKIIGLGQFLYDLIAKRRLIVPVNHCTDACDIKLLKR